MANGVLFGVERTHILGFLIILMESMMMMDGECWGRIHTKAFIGILSKFLSTRGLPGRGRDELKKGEGVEAVALQTK